MTNSELEKRFRDLTNELEATQRKLNRAEARTQETPQMLVQLQEEISIMKQSHVMALREVNGSITFGIFNIPFKIFKMLLKVTCFDLV